MSMLRFKGFHPIQEVSYRWFQFKRRIFGEHYWVGNEAEVGVCNDCADKNNLPYERQKKVPVRNAMPDCDNFYLCRDHWERLRNHRDPEVRLDLPPFIRTAQSGGVRSDE